MFAILLFFISLLFPFSVYPIVIGSDTVPSRQAAVTFPAADSDNEMRGFASFENGFTLTDSTTTCLFNSLLPVSGAILPKGGTVNLSRDLAFDSGAQLYGSGTFSGNTHNIVFPDQVNNFNLSLAGLSGFGFLDSVNTNTTVKSVDWAYDSAYVAIGVQTGAGNQVKVYSFDGSSLSLVDSVNMSDSVYSVRWHPSNYLLAVGRDSATGNEISIYELNTGTKTLTFKDGKDLSWHVRAVDWSADGTYLAVVRDGDGGSNVARLYVYSVSGGGILTLVTSIDMDETVRVSNNAVSWKSTGDYLVVGIEVDAVWWEIRVYSFNGSTLADDIGFDSGLSIKKALAWQPGGSWIAVGEDNGTERFRIYEHSPGSAVEKTAAQIGETLSVLSIDWDSTGDNLVLGRAAGSGTEFRTYSVNQTTAALTLVNSVEFSSDVNAVNQSPDDNYYAIGESGNTLSIYGALSDQGSLTFNTATLHFHSNVTALRELIFQGNCTIDAHGYTIDLTNTGAIAIDNGAQLTIKNAMIKGITTSNMYCNNSTSKLILDNVAWKLNGDYDFAQGSFEVLSAFSVTGTHVFSYKTDQMSTVKSHATFLFDSGATFKYNPPTTSGALLSLFDATATLHLYETELHATTTGLQLTKGTLVVEGTCPVYSDATVQDEGIKLGDGTAVNDVTVKVLPESGFQVNSGYLVYKNVG